MTTTRKVCIHGHYYQPPRVDPWLRELLPEGSAAPGLNWNQRILEESYAPLAWARRRDAQGRITDLVNCYAWTSFNFGPTLLSWLEQADPACYARILDADRQSLERWGHGNALAQCYHHIIMPLASPLDKEAQLAWTAADFRVRYRRDPEGLWLSEAAVDMPTLEAVAQAGFRFVVLAPRQARAVADMDGANQRDVDETSLDIREPYAAALSSGRELAVFFYHGPISQAVAFERLLEDGERYFQRITQAADRGLLCVATDGETYGHHFSFGEMALAYVLEQIRRGRDGLSLTNFAAYLADNPPARRILLHEPSSWSCVHGVERWRSDCGCADGGHPGWNQRWRGPLRDALHRNKQRVDEHYFTVGRGCFTDPRQALLDYGRVLAHGVSRTDFLDQHATPGLSPEERKTAVNLLAMQEWAMCSLASCAWFFDEISRVEPLNAMAYALRSMELAQSTGSGDWSPDFVRIMAAAESNIPGKGTGADLWGTHVLPRSMNLASWTQLGLLMDGVDEDGPVLSRDHGRSIQRNWLGAELVLEPELEPGPDGPEVRGRGRLTWSDTGVAEAFSWSWKAEQVERGVGVVTVNTPEGAVHSCSVADLAWNRRELVSLALLERQTQAWWLGQLRFARSASGHFQGYQEDQHRPIREDVWMLNLPALAWAVLVLGRGADDQEEFLSFLRTNWRPLREFDIRLAGHLLELLSFEQPDWAEAGQILERIVALAVPLNLWVVENRLWELSRKFPEAAGLARKLGIHPQTEAPRGIGTTGIAGETGRLR
ncbi:DUF3536 domain-containing protein [Desulfonatronum thiodismutans]|uniref:DUF3536 domain-containing protein n=1 Tax=Desulfonatronum thiodismutans TaxID=159290 RepID=UPI00068B7880|nr:DUF3536 domain-containing protein [Desulfonatronum thiodismutans]